MILSFLLSATFIYSSFASSPSRLSDRAVSNPDPAVGGSPGGGWQALPDIPDATLNDWTVDAGLGAKIPVLTSTGKDASSLKRAVIVLPGNPRDCWYYWNVMNNALYYAEEQDSSIKYDEVEIMSPCFFQDNDRVGALQDDQMSWGNMAWVVGQYNAGPSSVSGYSSFSALDALVGYYMDKSNFPNLNVVVIAGHSAGAQMAQRYLALRSTTADDDRLHFWIANPASFMWLTESRPIGASDGCSDIDVYKYGLSGGLPGYAASDFNSMGRDGIVSRYLGRQAHYAFGLADHEPGDTHCEAQTQGATHLERGQNFDQMLTQLGSPDKTTIDYIPSVGHDNVLMMQSDSGIDKLFKLDYGESSSTSKTKKTSTSSTSTPKSAKATATSGSSSSSSSLDDATSTLDSTSDAPTSSALTSKNVTNDPNSAVINTSLSSYNLLFFGLLIFFVGY